jgi:conserved hypothetical protein
MIYQAILKIRGKEIPILYYSYRCHIQHCDDPNLRRIIQLHIEACEKIGNREYLPVEGDLITLMFECSGDEQFFYDWLNEGDMYYGEIHFIYNESEVVDIFRFGDCFCVKIEESMSAVNSPMVMTVYLSPGIIKRNNLEAREKEWKVSDPASQSSAENLVKNETEKNTVSQESANFTEKSSDSLSETDQEIIDAQVAKMKQVSEKEEKWFKALLQTKDKKKPSSKQKGNYGEIKSCLNLLTSEKLKKGVNGKRYNLKRIGDDAPDSLDSKIRHGIDGIYENLTPVPDFVIDEVKYGTACLSETKKTGPQMGMKWILVRIEKLYREGILSDEQYEKLDMAIQNKTIDRIVSYVYSENEEIVTKKISLRNGCNEAKTKKDFVFSEWP